MTAQGHKPEAPGCRPRIRVLINPHSGEKAGIPTNTATEDEVRAAMEPYFPELGADLVVTESEEEARAATRDAIAKGYEIVVAAGGDGTVDAVACELLAEQALSFLEGEHTPEEYLVPRREAIKRWRVVRKTA